MQQNGTSEYWCRTTRTIRGPLGSLKGHNLVVKKNLQCYLYLLKWPVESCEYLLTHEISAYQLKTNYLNNMKP